MTYSKNIAQRIIQTERFRSLYKHVYYSAEAPKNLNDVTIEFSEQLKEESACNLDWLAWTYRNRNARHILINQILHERLNLISEDNPENFQER